MLRVGSVLIIVVSILHVLWGIALMFQPLHTAGIDVILALFRNNNTLAGLSFIAAGLFASISTWNNYNSVMVHALLLSPQQYLLLVSAIGAVQCMVSGHYADGVVRPSLFIFVDQINLVILCAFHALAMVFGYGFRHSVRISLC